MWFWYAILAAIFGAVENYANKKVLHNVRPILMTWAGITLSLPFIAVYAYIDGFAQIDFIYILSLLGASVFYISSKVIRNDSLKKSTLSKVTPLNSFGTFFTYILALVFLSETIHVLGVIGLILIVIGAYILNLDKAKEHVLEPIKVLLHDRVSLLFIVALMLGAIAQILNKYGIVHSNPPSASMALLVGNIMMTIILTFLLLKEKGWSQDLKQNFKGLFTYSMLFTTSSAFMFLAYISGPVALVGGIKNIDILFTLLIGMIFLNDKPTKHIWLATTLMIIGIICIKLA